METKLTTLVENLARVKTLSEGFEKSAETKRGVINEINESLTEDVKEKLRKGMNFTLVKEGRFFDSKKRSFDKRGQEHAVDVVGSLKRGYRMKTTKGTKKDDKEGGRSEYGALHDAYEIIVELTQQALAAKLPNGEPAYDPRPIRRRGEPIESEAEARQRVNDEIERDIFTPLVREGLLPETFVLDEYSEVAKLIKNSLKSYKETTQLKKEETEEAFAKNNFNYAGGGKKGTDRLSGMGGKLGRMVDQRLGDHAQEIKRGAKIGVDSMKALKEVGSSITGLKGVIKGKALERAKDFLDPKRPEAIAKLSPTRLKELGLTGPTTVKLEDVDEDRIRLQLDEQYKENSLNLRFDNDVTGVYGTPGTEDDERKKLKLVKLYEALNSDPSFYVQQGFATLKDYTEATIGVIKGATDTYKTYSEKVFAKRGAMTIAALRAAQFIDVKLQVAVSVQTNDVIGAAFDGIYADSFQVDDVMDALIDEAEGDLAGDVDLQKIVKVYADAFQKTFAKVTPKPKLGPEPKENDKSEPDLATALKNAGKALAESFEKKAEQAMAGAKKDWQKNLEERPELAFRPLAEAAAEAIGEPLHSDFLQAAKGDETARDMTTASLDLGDEAKLEELMRSDEEAKEFQKTLVLIDKGAMSVKSLEAMIQELKQSKEVIDLVLASGKAIFALPGGPMQLASRGAKGLTTEVTGEVLMAVKAAKLIMELIVNIKKAIDRWRLFKKFQQDTERARIAVSSLTSTLQGFTNNKKEQVTLNMINDVLTFVQAAANICGSVPTPYTLVIGKTVDKVAGALRSVNKVAGELYNEKMLSKGWAATKKAIGDPSDRAQGLKALRLNPTLGMHSIAWAAMERTPPDPVARMFLADLGITEQTLAASGTERKILEYLQTLLDEDRSLIDFRKINSKWAPDDPQLTFRDWFITVSRAQSDAEPPLAKGGDEAIMAGLKMLNGRKRDIQELEKKGNEGEIDLLEMEAMLGESEALVAALDDYEPVTTDGKPHDEMLIVAGGFLKQATERKDALLKIANANTRAAMEKTELVVKALNDLNRQLGEIVEFPQETVAKRFSIERMILLRDVAKKTTAEIGLMRDLDHKDNADAKLPFTTCETNIEAVSRIIITCEPRLAIADLQQRQTELDKCDDIQVELLNDPGIRTELEKILAAAEKAIEAVEKTKTKEKYVLQLVSELKTTIERIKQRQLQAKQLGEKQEKN